MQWLAPEDWFEKGHGIMGWVKPNKGTGWWYPKLEKGEFLWTPPPAAALVAVEELRKARLKRHDSVHCFVVPRLMTTSWLKQLNKVSDILFEVPCNDKHFWTSSQHEPLVVGIVFPFIPHRPWQLRNTPKMVAVERKLRALWKEDHTRAWRLLQQLFEFSRSLDSMPEGMVWKLLQTPHPGLLQGLRTRR